MTFDLMESIMNCSDRPGVVVNGSNITRYGDLWVSGDCCDVTVPVGEWWVL